MRRNALAVLATIAILLSPQALRSQGAGSPAPPAVPPAPTLADVLAQAKRRAQDAGPPVPPAVPAVPTLAAALAQAEQPRQGVVLAVGADQTQFPAPVPPDSPPSPLPLPGSSISVVADAYGWPVFSFGTVTAVVPPTMTLLNADPGTPNPFDGIPKGDAFRLLLGSLNDTQWAALTSSQGLGAADLTSPTQHALFSTLFPTQGVTVHKSIGWGNDSQEDSPIRLTETDMAQVRVRLTRRVVIGLPIVGKNAWMNSPDEPTDGQSGYQLDDDTSSLDQDTLYGVKIRDTVPNAPKDGDLDFSQPALQASLSLQGVETVGDLIARVGQTVRIELYADRRFEKRRVTRLGPDTTARAGDVLRALALCVCGAYRRVGPAYVLTDDVLGAGTRRMTLSRFAQAADMMRHGAVTEAGDRILTAHGSVDDLPMGATDLGFSDAERQKAAKDLPFPMPGSGTSVMIPLVQLTPAQQQAARKLADGWNGTWAAQPSRGEDATRITLDGAISLQSQPSIQMLTPAVPGPVDVNSYLGAWSLFNPSDKLRQAIWKQQIQQHPPPVVKPPTPPSLPVVLGPIPRRAVIARPRTARDVDSLVASMAALGLNQLWLDVFSGGKSHLDPPKDAQPAGPDILTEALAQTKGTGILVVPALDLLDWDKDAPGEAVDRTMLGETSAEATTQRRLNEAVLYSDMSEGEAASQPIVTSLSVSPASATVRQTLLALVTRLAAIPGIATLALRGTVTPGYDRPPGSHYSVQGDRLGYVTPLRLAFLRQQHIDPIDLDPESDTGTEMTADTSLPGFDDDFVTGPASVQWDALRAGADRDLMERLLTAARTSGSPHFAFWVKTRRTAYPTDWYGLWEDPRGPLPELSEEKAYGNSGPNLDYAAFARTQCRTNVFALDANDIQSAASLAFEVQSVKPGWDGFVLDLTDRPGDPLAALVKSLPKP